MLQIHQIIFCRQECFGCGLSLVTSPFIALVSGHHQWHIDCLRCSECDETLSHERSCYLRNGRILCKEDYFKLIKESVKCSKCFRQISPSDWVRRAASHVYHLACFACDLCQRQLSTGEQFTIDNQSNETKLLCKLHFGINKEGKTGQQNESCKLFDSNKGDTLDTSSNDSTSSAAVKPNKTKRVRTTFTEEQLQVLQANFQIDSNPDGQDLERIAALTGLSKRVTQVWFQNSRARQKKYLNKARNASSNSWTSNGDVSSPNSWPLPNTNDTSNNSLT
ncbi:LIM/homeobox protein Awh-like isoform X2 [Dinothrombium tinctorium]|uniref:LIM/homeobox protein Awh-like isoform X2 n=1 Tax=Dinothrombium tinctorium TaxID=1965070 RepID=A0A3S4RF42_9ACAR|nr:LIM/homeobox protein Awh-like isoform X2 [Dinothrombium tinctorium]RWS15409.1 LIM/homeobox protein Awh-like isoform X2 [Dinothrombium tinctorium]